MALETVTTINTLVETNPTSTDPASQGDDHIRNIKRAIKTTFPNITGPVTVSHTHLNTTALSTIVLSGGDGITTTIGDLSANRSISVDATVVRTAGNQNVGGVKTFLSIPLAPSVDPTANDQLARKAYVDTKASRTITLSGGDGITSTIGDLTANRTISVDATVARRNVSNVFTDVSSQSSGTTHYWMRDADAGPRALIYKTANSDNLVLRAYNAAGTAYREFVLNGANGVLTAPGFSGNVAATDLTGTIPNARLAGAYSFTDLTLTGRLKQGQTNAWGTGGLEVAGSIPNIWFNQTDSAMSGMMGVNGNSFFLVNDTNSSGTYDQIALEVPLTDTDMRYFGKALAYQGTAINAGNGLTGGGNLTATRAIALGTPSAITDTSTNSVTATSHTHSLGSLAVRRLLADVNTGDIGTTCLMGRDPNTTQVSAGQTVAGSSIRYAGLAGYGSSNDRIIITLGGAATGTWQAMGVLPVTSGGAGDPNRAVITTFMRVA